MGAITIYSRMPDAFSEGEVSLLTELAGDLAYGICTLRLRAAHALAEEALRSSEAKLQGIIGSAMDAVISVDQQQRIVVFNRAAEIVFQCAASAAIGSTLDRFIPEGLREVHHEHIRRFGSAGVTARSMNSPGILTAVRGNGEEFPIEATISQVQAGGDHIFTVILRDITARKQAEDALRLSEARLQIAVEVADLGQWDLDLNSHAAFRSLRHDQIFGYESLLPEWTYEMFLDHVLPEHRAEVDEKFKASLAAGTWDCETRVRRTDGEARWIWARGRVRKDEAGQPVQMFGTVMDITERKRAEEALRESERQFRQLADSMPQIVWASRPDGYLDYYNRKWYELTCAKEDEGGDQSWLPVMHPEDQQRCLDVWYESVRTGRPYQIEYRFKFPASGEYRWHLGRALPVRDDAGDIVRWFGTCTDIHDFKEAQEALRASEQRWATTLQSIGDAVISTDAAGNIEFMNDVAQSLTGWTFAEAKGRDLTAVFDIIQEVTRIKPENPVAKVIRLGKVIGLANHTVLIHRDGTEIPIEDSAAPIRDSKGQIEGVVLVFRDCLAQRKVEMALRNSDRLATTGKLAATIAHEIHNPLDAVGNLLYLIKQDTQDETTQQYVAMASGELARVTQMTRQMLAFQREGASPVPVKIGEILESVTALYERKIQSAGIRLEQHIDFDGHVLAMPGELRQILANLVGNAIEAIGPRRGRITLRAYESQDRRRGLSGLRVLVADDGPGIPEHVRGKIFEPFFTTKGEGGTGLGLWIASDILRKYDGTMRLRSCTQPHRSGTCFSLFLPFEICTEAPVRS